ncbi:MAG TPA: hypothetical protein VI792_02135, partial [Candidatus Eisenbacteria bacterium]
MNALVPAAADPASRCRVRHRRFRTAAAVLGALALGAGCRDAPTGSVTRAVSSHAADACQAAPLGTVTAFLAAPDGTGSYTITGTVAAFPAPEPQGLSTLTIHDGQGVDHVLSYEVPGQTLPVQQGQAYTFSIEHMGRFPVASALRISDGNGLLFAGVSDIAVGSLVLAGGIPGFGFTLMPATCESRPVSECYDALRNAPLHVTHGGAAADLMNGESADLGGYRVTCLTA